MASKPDPRERMTTYRQGGSVRAALPERYADDWSEEDYEMSGRARYPGEGIKGDEIKTPAGTWEMRNRTTRCNSYHQVDVRPPWSDDYIEAVPVHWEQGNWQPSDKYRMFRVARDDGLDMILVIVRVSTGAGDIGYRARYAGVYTASRKGREPPESRAVLPAAEEDRGGY